MDSSRKKSASRAVRPLLPDTKAFTQAVKDNNYLKNNDLTPKQFKDDPGEKALGNEKRLRNAIRHSLGEAKKVEGNYAFQAGYINEARQYHAYLKKYQSMPAEQRESRRYYPQVEIQKKANSNTRKPDLLKTKQVEGETVFSFVEFKSKTHDDVQRRDTLSIIGTKTALYKTSETDGLQPIGKVKSFKTLFAGKDGTRDAAVPDDPAKDNLTSSGKHSLYTPSGLAPENARSFTVITKHANTRKPATKGLSSFFAPAKVESKTDATPSALTPFDASHTSPIAPKKLSLSKSPRSATFDAGNKQAEQKTRLSTFEKKVSPPQTKNRSDNPFSNQSPIHRSNSFDEQRKELIEPKKRDRDAEPDTQPNKKVAIVGTNPTIPRKKPIFVRSDSDEALHSPSFGSISPSPPQSPRNNTNNANFPVLNPSLPQTLHKPVVQSLSNLPAAQARVLAPKIKEKTTGIPPKTGLQKKAPQNRPIAKPLQQSKKAKAPETRRQGTLDTFFVKK